MLPPEELAAGRDARTYVAYGHSAPKKTFGQYARHMPAHVRPGMLAARLHRSVFPPCRDA
ncbi:hypothetical protein DESPIG_01043 [Desulfovibrio piger ATCC 29098]|uniref:Uncharacterized protein n=1 Tax=Desulfovibrio piger ATCC 29098 TaxID=411464 RepID=B6WSC1_9BACT|nr:hypothetical protein DESPIG_01043 [Desulfovibrio piger ATCC 29098]